MEVDSRAMDEARSVSEEMAASSRTVMAIDTTLAAEDGFASLEELEDELTRMKARCDSDPIHSSNASTVSSQSINSAASSPLNESGGNANLTLSSVPPRVPTQGRASTVEEEVSSGASSLAAVAAAANRFGVSRPLLSVRRTHSTTEIPGRTGLNLRSQSPIESVGKLKRVSSVETRRAYALSVKARMSDNSNVDDGIAVRKPLVRKRSSNGQTIGAASAAASAAAATSTVASMELITPSIITTPRRRKDSIASTTSSVSSIASSPSTTSSVSNMSSVSTRSAPASTTASRLQRVRSMAGLGVTTTASASSSTSTSTTTRAAASSSSRTSTTSTAKAPTPSSARATSSSARTTPTASLSTKTAAAASSSASTTPSSSSRVSPGKLSPTVPPPKVSVMQKLLLAANAEAKDATIDLELVKQLKQQYVLAEQGVQQLLRPGAGAMPPPPSPVRAAETEVRRLKGGIKTLNEHSVALMLACEVLQRQQDEKNEELSQMRVMNDQLMREVETLASASKTSSGFSSPVSSEDTNDNRAEAMDDDEIDSEDSAPPRPVELARRRSADSSLSAFVNEMLRTATEKIEEKWKARFAEKLAEHERALSVERERAFATVMTNSRLVTETKHEKEDEMKALREENVGVKLENKQLSIELAALRIDLDYMKEQLNQQDEIRNSSSFWEKTTDLARQNRTLAEELTFTQQTVKKLNEVIKDLRTQSVDIRAENEFCVKRTKELEMEKQVLEDRLVEVEAKFEDEKARREQFQVNVEQLTVENTALYAQMVALQATHEAKMEEQRTNFEKRNVILAGEMRALQAQNKLMRKMDGNATGGSSASSSGEALSGASGTGTLSAEAERELDARLQQLTDELLTVRQELVARTDQISELERKVADGEIVRRKLHNTIQELRGNIRVHVRLRPFLRSDGEEAKTENPRSAIRCDGFGGTISTNVEKPHTFAFDKVYGQSESQDAVFTDVADFIQSAMDGYNVCIFAYGQTGSGKTHTMQGSGKAQMRGIIPRALQLIINTCRDLSVQGWQYTLDVTFFEIYNETIRDLLTGGGYSTGDDDRKLNIRTDKRGKNYVDGLTTVPIDFDVAEEQLEEIVNVAACNRSVDKTDMNAHSSRSHSIFGLTIRGVNEAQNTEVEGSLSLVDLAGSERLSRSNATGDRLKEAQAINKSLSALADVFQALAKKSAHVPYRNSKLTYVLQPALSGDGKTLMMVNLSPTFGSVDESVCSLRFAQNVSQCELGAPTRQIKARAPTSGGSSSMLGASAAAPANVRSSPARALANSASMGTPTATASGTTTPTTTRTRSQTAATPPIAKKLQF